MEQPRGKQGSRQASRANDRIPSRIARHSNRAADSPPRLSRMKGGSRMYSHSFSVRGSGSFPVDMLRYDACFPGTNEAVDGIMPLDRDHDTRTVALRHHSTDRKWQPTKERWYS